MFLPRLSNKKWSLVFAVVGLVASIIALMGMKSYQPTNAYILQGASKGSMISLVNDIGGKVVHNFAVIPAISALLTDDQVNKIKKTNPLIRLFSDAKVELKAKAHKKEWQNKRPMRFKADKNKATWVAKNRTGKSALINSITVEWPEENGKLKKLKLDKKLLAKKVKGQTYTHFFDEPLEVKSGKKLKMVMTFADLQNVNDSDYTISLNLQSGVSVNMESVKADVERGLNRDTYFPAQVNADKLHQVGITGKGVGVAVIDSGLSYFDQLDYNSEGEQRNVHRATVTNILEDDFGHGTHVTSLIANSSPTYDENGHMTLGYNGIAPDVDLISVKAFDDEGNASYTDILLAIEYVLNHKDELNIKVLNLSFGATPDSLYHLDPINIALFKVWSEGIVVVSSAGNTGPDSMTVGVPGNNPFIITVGATSDNHTPFNMNDDFIGSFSSSGPTNAGFIKPEILAPGAHMQGLISSESALKQNYGMYDDNNGYFLMSGTSQSTGIVSGVVALMLQEKPNLSPDDVKCRLLHSGRKIASAEGESVYSIFRQGSGLVDAMVAVSSEATNCANVTINVDAQLDNLDAFYAGPARFDLENLEFYVNGYPGYEWNGKTDDLLIDDLVASNGLIFESELRTAQTKGLIFESELRTAQTKGLIFESELRTAQTEGLIFESELRTAQTKGLIFESELRTAQTKGLIFESELRTAQTKGLIFESELRTAQTKGLIFESELRTVQTKWLLE